MGGELEQTDEHYRSLYSPIKGCGMAKEIKANKLKL